MKLTLVKVMSVVGGINILKGKHLLISLGVGGKMHEPNLHGSYSFIRMSNVDYYQNFPDWATNIELLHLGGFLKEIEWYLHMGPCI